MSSDENNGGAAMLFCEALGITRGITALIGSGGKTSLQNRLAAELRGRGRVILCTTTHIMPPPGMRTLERASAEEVRRALETDGAVCVGESGDDGRLHPPLLAAEELAALADYLLVEADGSKRLPLKAHESFEPVIPAGAARTVCVVGLTGLGRPIAEAAHRSDIFAALARCGVYEPATPERAARVLNAEALADVYFLNQADAAGEGAARELAALLRRPTLWGSIQKGEIAC